MQAFISYSHADEKGLEQFQKHLAVMSREGAIAAWYDHKILPGDQLDKKVMAKLDEVSLFLPLVSPDFLDSNYCYEKEFSYALKREASGSLRIVPIILEPCDWLSSPLNKFKALPKDGKPISEWANRNNAFLNVINGLRRITEEVIPSGGSIGAQRAEALPARRPKIKRTFDVVDKSDFAEKAFSVLREYFEKSCQELGEAGPDLRAKFEPMSYNAFSCTVVNRALSRGGEASITLHSGKRRSLGGDITFSYERLGPDNTMNGSISVDSDDYNLFLRFDFSGFHTPDDQKYSSEQVAEQLWIDFVKRAGIEYE